MSDIENLTLKQLNQIMTMFSGKKEEKKLDEHLIGKYVIVRTYSAGVHFGIHSGRSETEILLKDSRRIWCWEGAFTLSAVAEDGIKGDSKLSKEIPEILITQCIEVIPCSEKAIKCLKNIEAHTP